MVMTPGRILRRTLSRNTRRLTVGTLLLALHQACEASVPILIGVIIDRAVTTGDAAQLVLWTAALGLLFVLLSTAYRQGARQAVQAVATETHLLRTEIAGRIIDPRGVRTELRTGDLLTITSDDTEQAAYLLEHVARVVGALVATAVGAVALFVISVPLGLVVLLATPAVLLALQLTAPLMTRRYAEQQRVAGRASALATDLVTGLRPLRGIGAQDAAARRYREVSRASLSATLHAVRARAGFAGGSATVSTLLACGIAVLAGWFALTGRITPGQFITVIGLAQFLGEPFGTLAIVPGRLAEARGSAQRISLVLSADPVLPAPDREPTERAELVVRDLHSGPLRGLDLRVGPGEFVGVVAHRPADADELADLLGGQRPAERGEIAVAGAAPHEARDMMLAEPHHTSLFTGTIRTNLGNNLDEALDEALRASAADEVVALHPDGLDHPVAERGADLSGGQRQRLALARALAADPPILVLHEPTTAVDAVTEHAIAQGIRSLRHGSGSDRATVVLTSSPALLAQTDRVLVIDGGAVVAESTHATLVAGDPAYRKAVLR
ncbi:ABC transporter ATP-binding protein [Actinoplanes sp. NPDC051633]|uniref:ABC transporter ATP-binding protein n=1 Tax=Actinoplanes sp. NPDC051633 TaxID=3155670 RepID=UPI0034260E00